MQDSTAARWLWELCYLLSTYFQVINITTLFTLAGVLLSSGECRESDHNALITFSILSNAISLIVILFSTFKRSRPLVFPAMCLGVVMYLITMSLQTHIVKHAPSVNIDELWQWPLGWSAWLIQVLCLLTIRFWDKNESEDKYSRTGYCGKFPVFSVSRFLCYSAGICQLLGQRGFYLQELSTAPLSTLSSSWTAFHNIGVAAAVLTFAASAVIVVKPSKLLMILVCILCAGLNAGQAALGQMLHDQNISFDKVPASAWPQWVVWDWVIGYSWYAFTAYVVALIMTLMRCD